MPEKFYVRYLLVLIMAGLLAACSVAKLTVKVNTSQAESVNLSSFKTYNWYQADPVATASVKAPYNTELATNIRLSLEEELQKRGFTKTTQNPDLLVAFDVSQPRNVGSENTYSNMLGYRYAYGNSRLPGYKPVGSYPANSLFIDFIDPKDNELIWRGYTENVIEDYNFRRSTVQNLVDDILDKLAKTN